MNEQSITPSGESGIPDDKRQAAEQAFQRGLLHHSNRRWEQALVEFEAACEIDPQNDRYLFKLSAAYHNTGQYERSAEMYTKLINILRQRPFKEQLLLALAYKGGNLALLKRFDEAERLINEALEMDSVSPIGLGMKGLLLHEMGESKKALEVIKLAHEVDPSNKIVNAIRDKIVEALE